jgi:phosphatidylserine synthase
VKIFNSFFAFYIKSSIHVALAVTMLVYVTEIQCNILIPVAYYWVAFLGTITGYNCIKYSEIAGLQHKILIKSLQNLQVFSLLVFFVLLYFLVQLEKDVLLFLGLLGLLTLLYLIPTINHKNLRSISGVKVFIVALVWSGLTLLIPVYQAQSLPADVWLYFVQRFFIILTLIVPFEIRDLQEDGVNLFTLPQLVGVKRTKQIGFFLVLIVLLLERLKGQTAVHEVWILFAVCSLIFLSIFYAKTKQSKYFASFWVEGIPIFWGVVLYLFCNFLA